MSESICKQCKFLQKQVHTSVDSWGHRKQTCNRVYYGCSGDAHNEMFMSGYKRENLPLIMECDKFKTNWFWKRVARYKLKKRWDEGVVI